MIHCVSRILCGLLLLIAAPLVFGQMQKICSEPPAPVKYDAPLVDTQQAVWVASSQAAIKVDGARVTFRGIKGRHFLIYNHRLGDDYNVRFRESRRDVSGDVVVHWVYDPIHPKRRGPDGRTIETAEAKLVLFRNGRAEVRVGRKTVARLAPPAELERRWTIVVKGLVSVVSLDGKPVAQFEHPRGDTPVPFVMLQAKPVLEKDYVFDELGVESAAPGSAGVLVRQWALPPVPGAPHHDRLTLAYSSKAKAPQVEAFDIVPQAFLAVRSITGKPVAHVDPIVFGWNGPVSSYRDDRVFLFVRPRLKLLGLTHEFSHAYACGGGKCGAGAWWLVEGLAEWMGSQALNRLEGRPDWITHFDISRHPRYREIKLGGFMDPPLTTPKAEVARMFGGPGVATYAGYLKGSLFLDVLSEVAGYDAVRKVIAANQGRNVTGIGFLSEVGTMSGRDVLWLRSGWLEAGPYEKVSPLDAIDTDRDGLKDFQEILRGSDKTRKDLLPCLTNARPAADTDDFDLPDEDDEADSDSH